ncbi:hypothetical protein VTL71DRAFT_13073 [Oculimacula yallundae]|uniref:Uncharacterized protein n=1 Tax=Oculimacula yallundae TaxID=86028 RepID=A0ABR4CP94_9HELO
MLLTSSIASWVRVKNMVELYKQKRWAESARLRFATGFNYQELEIIFKVLRIFNFFWIIYSALLIEFSLNFNNVTAVLKGRNNGKELHLPAHIFPLLMGTFGLVQILYLLVQSKRTNEDAEPSLATSSLPQRSRTLRVRSLLLTFSPAMSRDSTTVKYDPEEIDDLRRGRAWTVRYLVSWLPWLSLLGSFQDMP